MKAYFNGDPVSVSEVQQRRDRRYSLPSKRAAKALKRNGADDDQIRHFRMLCGEPTTIAVCSAANAELAVLAQERLFTMFQRIIETNSSSVVDLEVYVLEPDERTGAIATDLKTAVRIFGLPLRHRFEHSVATFRPLALNGSITMGVSVLGVRSVSEGAIRRPSRRPRAHVLPTPPMESKVGLTSAAEMYGATCEFFDPTAFPGGGPHAGPDGSLVKLTRSDSQRELESLFLRAFMPADRILFGHGLGKAIVKALIRELRARARSFDITGTSPIRPAGVASFLAGLPSNDGECFELPAITVL